VLAAVLVAGSAFVSGAGASSAVPLAQAGSAAFTDPSGDAQGGPDVTQVAVSGDAVSGSIALTVTVPGYIPAVTDALERDVVVWLDTDLDRATGDPEDGTEYALQAWNDPSGRWWNILRWTGTEWDSVSQSPTMGFARQGDALMWTVAASDIGGSTKFRFYVFAGTWNEAADKFDATDEAPDVGWWSFDSATSSPPPPPAASKVGLLVGAPKIVPPVAVAGKRLTVQYRVQVQRTEQTTVIDLETGEPRTSMVTTWEPAAGGRISCAVSIAGQKLSTRCSSFKGDLAQLSLVVPKTAKGKLLKISVTLVAKDSKTGKTLTTTRVVASRVK
jgi:hypothetical protein